MLLFPQGKIGLESLRIDLKWKNCIAKLELSRVSTLLYGSHLILFLLVLNRLKNSQYFFFLYLCFLYFFCVFDHVCYSSILMLIRVNSYFLVFFFIYLFIFSKLPHDPQKHPHYPHLGWKSMRYEPLNIPPNNCRMIQLQI